MRILFHFSLFFIFGFLLREKSEQSANDIQQSAVTSHESTARSQQPAVDIQQSVEDSVAVVSRPSALDAH